MVDLKLYKYNQKTAFPNADSIFTARRLLSGLFEEDRIDNLINEFESEFPKLSFEEKAKLCQKFSDFNLPSFNRGASISFDRADEFVTRANVSTFYAYDNTLKKALLSFCYIDNDQGIAQASRASNLLRIAIPYEKKVNKTIFQWDKSEFESYIRGVREEYTDVITFQQVMVTLSQLIDGARKVSNVIVAPYVLHDIAMESQPIVSEIYPTLSDLHEVAYRMDDPQASAMVILCYLGVKISRNSESDEMLSLKKSDLDGNVLTISGNAPRKIKLDNRSANIVRAAIRTEFEIFDSASGSQRKMYYVNSDRIFRPLDTNRTTELTWAGMSNRVRKFANAYKDSFNTTQLMNVRRFETAGKMNSVHTILSEEGVGDDEMFETWDGLKVLDDALMKTANRFGQDAIKAISRMRVRYREYLKLKK